MKVFKSLLLFIAISTLLVSCEKKLYAYYEVVPLPQYIIYPLKDARFVLNEDLIIYYPDSSVEMKRNAEFLSYYIKQSIHKDLDIKEYSDKQQIKYPAIMLDYGETVEQEQGYVIKTDANYVGIKGRTPQGVFYGVQTLRKAIPPEVYNHEEVILYGVFLEDYPRFPHRGMYLDTSEQIFSMEYMKGYIDLLALHNMNCFYWQMPLNNDSITREFYTANQLEELIEYAALRYVTVISDHDFEEILTDAMDIIPANVTIVPAFIPVFKESENIIYNGNFAFVNTQLPIDKLYNINPDTAKFVNPKDGYVIGVHKYAGKAHALTARQIEYDLLPRMATMSEVQWTNFSRKDYKEFGDDCTRLFKLYERDSLNYATDIFDIAMDYKYEPKKKGVVVHLNTIDDAPVYYTLDGSKPTEDSKRYRTNIVIKDDATLRAVAVRSQGMNSKEVNQKIIVSDNKN